MPEVTVIIRVNGVSLDLEYSHTEDFGRKLASYAVEDAAKLAVSTMKHALTTPKDQL